MEWDELLIVAVHEYAGVHRHLRQRFKDTFVRLNGQDAAMWLEWAVACGVRSAKGVR